MRKIPSELKQSMELFANLTQRELKGKYKRTVFGQLWSLANPLALMLVYTFVFSFVIKIQIPVGSPSGLDAFPLWLLCGLLPWIFFSTVLTQSMSVLISNESLIRKVSFPRSLLVYSSIAALAVNWLTEMLVLIFALILAGGIGVIPLIPLLVLEMLIFAVFTTGLALMLSIANVYFRDTQHFVTIALQLGMYLTPVVYPLSLVESESQKIGPLFSGIELLDFYLLNPLVDFISVFRDVLFNNSLPDFGQFLFCFLSAIISLLLGLLVFNKHQKKLAEIL